MFFSHSEGDHHPRSVQPLWFGTGRLMDYGGLRHPRGGTTFTLSMGDAFTVLIGHLIFLDGPCSLVGDSLS